MQPSAFTVPFSAGQPNPALLGSAATILRPTSTDRVNEFVVLHVDRADRQARAVRLNFVAPGYRSQTPLPSIEALDCIRTGCLDLIVEGHEIPQSAHATNGAHRNGVVRAIALSTRAALESGTRLRNEGFDVHYLPPILLTELINDIAGWLRADLDGE